MLACDKKNKGFNIVVYISLIFFFLLIFIPIVYIIANSLSNPEAVNDNDVFLWPVGWDFSTYATVLKNPAIQRGFLNSFIYTVCGTLISIVLTISVSYVLARKDFAFKKPLSIFLLITMFISGGLIPTYLIVKSLGLLNNPLSMILPGCLSVWNVIVCKNYIESNVPWDVIESSKLDGANDFSIFFRIVVPMCGPIIVTMVLFYGIGYWNSYFSSLLYLTNSDLFPLQRVLYDIIEKNSVDVFDVTQAENIKKSIQYVSIVVSTLPILLIYPFIGKYMEKSVSVGSVKG